MSNSFFIQRIINMKCAWTDVTNRRYCAILHEALRASSPEDNTVSAPLCSLVDLNTASLRSIKPDHHTAKQETLCRTTQSSLSSFWSNSSPVQRGFSLLALMSSAGMVFTGQKTLLAEHETHWREWFSSIQFRDFIFTPVCREVTENLNMLDDKAPRSKIEAPSRGSSFYIENLLGSTYRGAFTEQRKETPGSKVTEHSPGICPGLEANRLGEALNRSGTSPGTTYCSSRSKWLYVSKQDF